MSVWHAVLPGDLIPSPIPRVAGNKLMVWGPGETGAGIGHADVTKHGDHLVILLDDATFKNGCRQGDDGTHDHRLDVTHGVTRYVRPRLIKTPQGYSLIGVEVTGFDHGAGDEIELRPGSRPAPPPIPPRPRLSILGE